VLRLALHSTPEVSLVSAAFGTGHGFSLAHRLKECAVPSSVLIYADTVDPRLAGAAMVAGADGVFASEADTDVLGELIGRVLGGEKVFPPLLPDPFEELASRVDEPDRRIVAMLLEGAPPDAIASLCGVSEREIAWRREAVVRLLDAAYALAPIPQWRAQPYPHDGDNTISAPPRSEIVG
jgi:DNA-binding NarL/FixJ family response regulator